MNAKALEQNRDFTKVLAEVNCVDVSDSDVERLLRREKLNIVFVVPMPMYPICNGGAARIWAMTDFLRQQGHKIGMVTVAHSSQHAEEMRTRLDNLWMKAWVTQSGTFRLRRILATVRRYFLPKNNNELAVPFTNNALFRRRDLQIEELAVNVCNEAKPDVIVCVFAWTAPLLDRLDSSIIKVVDTIDVQHLRDKAAIEAGYPALGIDCTAEDEAGNLAFADIIIAIQREERDCLKRLLPDKKIVLVEHALPLRPLLSPENSRRVLFIGNRYQPNTEGILAFIYSVWPKVRAACGDAELVVCGNVCQDMKNCPEKGIISLGLVPDPALEILNSAVIINPVPFGTGLKIKAVEAMANCKCLVSTRQGILGLHSDIMKSATVVPLEEMAPKIINYLKSPVARRRQERKAMHFARRHLRPDVVYAELEDALIQAHQRRAS